MRRNIKHSDRKITFNKNFMKVAIFREPSLIDDFYIEERDVKGKKVVFHQDPLYVLFNQQRLNQLSTEQVRDWLSTMTNKGNNDVAQLKAKCSDDELIQMIRNRSFQNPAEISLWCQEMNNNVESFKQQLSDAQKAIEEAKQSESIVESKPD